jgi:GT2 family glycosyltransferase/glycosyltransferase involved in cell wall biosynthesis
MAKRWIIDVIVPIHDAYEEVIACLASVQRHRGDYRLILIDDCSADERIGALFRRLSAERLPDVVLLRNERNLGFVGTANRGMALGRNDVVLLNSDCLVTHGWLDKMRRCAASDSRIGTITPFSNNAEICSAPWFCQDNPAPDDPELTNRAMELAAVPIYPDIPTAVGFCMFIRRELIREIGVFDPIFGKGYGEENDFSMRARKAGYRNVLCDDTFIVHLGSRSFGSHRQSMVEQNLVKVLAKHPDYMEIVRDFIERDPIAPIRGMGRSQVALLANQGKPGVLHVIHPRGGGTEKYVQELMSASHDDYRHYLLRILHDRWQLVDANGAAPVNYECLRQGDGSKGDWLRSLCSWLHIELTHVHSLVGSGDDLLRILEETSIPYCYSVHDMYLACPTVYLIDSGGEYCNATTDNSVCRQCLSKIEGLEDTDIAQWRVRYRAFLDKASKIFAPSKWARDTLAKYYPGINVTIAPPWPEPVCNEPARGGPDGFDLPSDECRHVAVLGAIGPEKGARHLDALVAGIRERRLPLRIVVVGYTDRDHRCQSSDKVLTVHGPYRRPEIEALFDYYRIALVVFPTIWPETFSYTLSEGWLAGRPALVPPTGALQERVLATGAGWIMDGWPKTDSILDQVMQLTAPENGEELERKARVAKSLFREGHHAAERVGNLYSDVLSDTAGKAEHAISRLHIYEAACRALGMDPSSKPAVRAVAGPVPRPAKITSLLRLFRG